MEIKNLRREPPGGPVIAHFDLQVVPEFKLLDCVIRQVEGGDYVVFPPQARRLGQATAMMSRDARIAIRDAALAQLGADDAGH